MKEEKELKQENKPDKIRLKMTIAIIILAALFIVELYLMMNYSESYLFLGIIGLAMLCLVYLIIDTSFKIKNDRSLAQANEYESIYKAQKVSYVSMKQSFLDIEKTLDRIRENSDVPTEELIQAQKAVGKVTIKRNKENAAAIINSNEKLMESIASFENRMSDIISSLNQPDDDTGIDFNPQEITEALTKMQADMKAEISAISSNIEAGVHAMKDEIIREVEEKITSANEEMMQKVSEIKVEPVIVEKPVLITEPAVSTEPVQTETTVQTESVKSEESTVQAEPEMTAEPVVQEEIKAAAASAVQEEFEKAAESTVLEELEKAVESVIQEDPKTAASAVQEEFKATAESIVQEEFKATASVVQEEFETAAAESAVQEEFEKAAEPVIQEDPKTAASVVQEEPEKVTASTVQEAPKTAASVVREAPEKTAEPVVQKASEKAAEPVLQKNLKTAPEPVIQKEPEIEKDFVTPVQNVQSGKQMSQEDISSLFNKKDDTVEEDSPLSEPVIISEEPKTTGVNLESGKNMTPGEIADLLSEINEKPEPEPEIEEDKSTSNLGHVMTPEEIAALLADM